MSRTRPVDSTPRAAEPLFRVAVVALLCCGATSAYGQSASHSYREAFKESSATGKPLLVLVGADWCHHCVVVKHELLPQLKKSGLLDQVAFAYVDYDRDGRLVGQLMRGQFIPEMILFTKSHDGWKVNHLSGATSLSELKEFIKSGLRETTRIASTP